MVSKHYNFNGKTFAKRIGIILLSLYLLLMGLSLRGQLVSSATVTPSYDTHIVSKGETLWDIASEIQTDQDIRSIVYDIQVANEMTTPRITVGQIIKVPAQ